MFNSSVSVLVISILMCMPLSACDYYRDEKQAGELLQECKELKAGMTREEVIEFMGEPVLTYEVKWRGRAEERLQFHSSRRASAPPTCIIDKSTGLVVEIRCEENRQRTLLEEKCGELQRGMAREEVIAIMGQPSYIEQVPSKIGEEREEWLYFISPRYPEEVGICVIDMETGLVFEILFDEINSLPQ